MRNSKIHGSLDSANFMLPSQSFAFAIGFAATSDRRDFHSDRSDFRRGQMRPALRLGGYNQSSPNREIFEGYNWLQTQSPFGVGWRQARKKTRKRLRCHIQPHTLERNFDWCLELRSSWIPSQTTQHSGPTIFVLYKTGFGKWPWCTLSVKVRTWGGGWKSASVQQQATPTTIA